LEEMAKGLIAALDLGPREHVAVVGGGGKTTLCFALARELSGAGKKVITTTTTKVWHSEANRSPCVVFCHSGPAFCVSVKEGLRRAGHVFVAQRPLESGKVEGISPSMADSLFQDLQLDYLIAEADGAEGRPLKAPAAHEPVIPSSATVMIAMMGIEAIGRPLGPEIVFRAELFRKIAGLGDGEILNPALLARAFQAPTGSFKGAPDSARRIAFLNKLDLVPDGQDARTLAGLLLRGPHAPAERVVIGSLLQNIYFTIH
jgi:probable selenium-dependent hydroxylase accessory protein YqeC